MTPNPRLVITAIETRHPGPYRIFGFRKGQHPPKRNAPDPRWDGERFGSLKEACNAFRKVIEKGDRYLFLVDANDVLFGVPTATIEKVRG